MAQGEYTLIVNDDDLWEQRYIEKTVSYLESHPEIDLVYGSVIYINSLNFIMRMYTPHPSERYGKEMTRNDRVMRYTQLRNVIPINFGLFRTKVIQKVFPYEDFDTLKANLDNQFMTKFFLLGYNAEFIPNLFFFYRLKKSRRLNPKVLSASMPPIEHPVALWFFYINHLSLFYKNLKSIAEKHPYSKK